MPNHKHRTLRHQSVKVKTAKGRKISSTKWLQRQLNDPYTIRAKNDGYASRAAYKLLEIDTKFHILGSGKTIIDLGAAPGSWTQVALKSNPKKIIAVDLVQMKDIDNVQFILGDFTDEATLEKIYSAIKTPTPPSVILPAKAGTQSNKNPTQRVVPLYNLLHSVIPAKAGIQYLSSGLTRGPSEGWDPVQRQVTIDLFEGYFYPSSQPSLGQGLDPSLRWDDAGWGEIFMPLKFAFRTPVGLRRDDGMEINENVSTSKVDVILSDMAPNTSGHRDLDHLKIIDLCEHALEFAKKTLAKDGILVMKTFQGGQEKSIANKLKKSFSQVKFFKPGSSRKDSSEIFLVATGFT